MRRPEKKPTKSPFQPLNWPATAATVAQELPRKGRPRSGGPHARPRLLDRDTFLVVAVRDGWILDPGQRSTRTAAGRSACILDPGQRSTRPDAERVNGARRPALDIEELSAGRYRVGRARDVLSRTRVDHEHI